MTEHSFTLIIQGDVDSRIDDLFEAGCDDATFGSVDGVQYADFDRAASTLLGAISSAISSVESVPGLQVLRVEPDDLVTAAEIAARLGRSRESIRLLIAGKRGPGGFPTPVSHLRSRNRLWRWSDVVAWAVRTDISAVERARLVAATNAALALRATMVTLQENERAFITELEHARVS